MEFDFTGIKANLEGINKYLESNGIKLSDDESQQLVSIFNKVDTSVYKEGEQGYNDGQLDFLEENEFKKQIASILPKLKENVNSFFGDLQRKHINKLINKELEQKQDAIKNYKPQVEKDIKITKTVPTKTMPIETKITAQHKVIASGDTVYDEKLMNQALNNLIKNNSKLKDKAAAFVKSAQNESHANKLDPFVLIAISMEESARGVSNASMQKNNIGGIMGKRGLRKFDNVESCIDSIASTINKRVTEGYKTISSIGYSGRYCAKSVAPHWIKNVTMYAESLRQEYNKLAEQNKST